jgi:hypothetical protein
VCAVRCLLLALALACSALPAALLAGAEAPAWPAVQLALSLLVKVVVALAGEASEVIAVPGALEVALVVGSGLLALAGPLALWLLAAAGPAACAAAG